MKKILIILLLSIAQLISNQTAISPKTLTNQPPAQTANSQDSQATTSRSNTEKEEDDNNNEDETDTPETPLTRAPQKPTTANTPTTAVTPSEKTTLATTPIKQEQSENDEKETTRSIIIFNKTGRTVTIYGISSNDTNPKLLTTLQVGSAPAQVTSVPVDIDTIFVEDKVKSNTISLDANTQLVTIKIADSIGSFTYNLTTFKSEYGDYLTVYNGTTLDQTIIIEMSANVPGLVFSTTTTPRYAYTISPKTIQIITFPQLASPAVQNKQAKCGLPNTTNPLAINTSEPNVLIITQDNGTATLHKV